MWLLAAAAVVLLWLMWPDTEELRLRLEQLEEENRILRSAQSERGDDSSVMWISALAVAGGVVFTVLVGAAFVGQVQTERDHLQTRLEKLETRLQGAEAERSDLKTRVRRLQNEAAAFAEAVRERDQWLRGAEAENDRLKRRVRRLENEAATNRRAGSGDYAAGLALLGLQSPFTHEAARTAYRNVSRTIHPDVCKGPEANRLMRLATECYERITKA